jgi:hypothetical protein
MCCHIRHVILVPMVLGDCWGRTIIWGDVNETEMAAQHDNGLVVTVDLHIVALTCTIASSLRVV